jgi:hypothetical protein
MPALNPHKKKALITLFPPLSESPALPTTFMNNKQPHHLDSAPLAAAVFTLTTQPAPKPHPEQGGERISLTYLHSLSEAECIWHFR